MFTVVITEKGGNKRELEFDEEQVSIGRVQGNQVVLPRGNVSKRHAKLEYKAGEFRLTDLGSTNGTYINGRRLTEPTRVGTGDKVYIGEFILGFTGHDALELPDDGTPGPPRPAVAAPKPAVPRPKPEADPPKAAAPKPSKPKAAAPKPSKPKAAAPKPSKPKAPAPAPDRPRVPRPSASALTDAVDKLEREIPAPTLEDAQTTGLEEPPTIAEPAGPVVATADLDELVEQLLGGVARQVKRVDRSNAPAHVDEGTAGKIRLVLQDLIADLQARGSLPGGAGAEELFAAAFRAAVDLGPLAGWLEDPTVEEIRILRPNAVFLLRDGAWKEATSGFVSEEELANALRCLGAGIAGRDEAGVPGLIRFRLEEGTLVLAALAPVTTSGPSAVIYRNLAPRLGSPPEVSGGLRGDARRLVEEAIGRGDRIAVVGAAAPLRMSMLAEVARLLPDRGLVVGVEDLPLLGFGGPHRIGLAGHGARGGGVRSSVIGALLPRATDLGPDWIVISGTGWADLPDVLACAGTRRGVIADLPLGTGEQLDRQLAAGLFAAGVAIPPFAAPSALAAAFDRILVVDRSDEGLPLVRQVLASGTDDNDDWRPEVLFAAEG